MGVWGFIGVEVSKCRGVGGVEISAVAVTSILTHFDTSTHSRRLNGGSVVKEIALVFIAFYLKLRLSSMKSVVQKGPFDMSWIRYFMCLTQRETSVVKEFGIWVIYPRMSAI